MDKNNLLPANNYDLLTPLDEACKNLKENAYLFFKKNTSSLYNLYLIDSNLELLNLRLKYEK